MWLVKGAPFVALATILGNVTDVRKNLIEWFPSTFGDPDVKFTTLTTPDSQKLSLSEGNKGALKLYYTYSKEGRSTATGCSDFLIIRDTGRTLQSASYDEKDPPPFPTIIEAGNRSERVGAVFSSTSDFENGGKARLWIRCSPNVGRESEDFDLKKPVESNALQQTPANPPVSVTPTNPTSAPPAISKFSVCLGQYHQVCGNSTPWVGCGADISQWARSNHPNECSGNDKKVSVAQLTSVSGNQCGYGRFEVTCTSSN
jgi:hypothetical protein